MGNASRLALALLLSGPGSAEKPKLSENVVTPLSSISSGRSEKPTLSGNLHGISSTLGGKGRKKVPSTGDVNFKISFRIKAEELDRSGNFVVKDGTQSNYVIGGDMPYEYGDDKTKKGISFKKFGVIVNALPVTDPENPNLVEVQIQFEISGPVKSQATSLEMSLMTFQYQTEFQAEKGRELVLVDEPSKRIEIRIDEVKP